VALELAQTPLAANLVDLLAHLFLHPGSDLRLGGTGCGRGRLLGWRVDARQGWQSLTQELASR
jgi:hypothetical protein